MPGGHRAQIRGALPQAPGMDLIFHQFVILNELLRGQPIMIVTATIYIAPLSRFSFALSTLRYVQKGAE